MEGGSEPAAAQSTRPMLSQRCMVDQLLAVSATASSVAAQTGTVSVPGPEAAAAVRQSARGRWRQPAEQPPFPAEPG